MPGQQGKSKLASKLGNKAREAHDKHKGDETRESGGGGLPGGIENGIALLESITFGEFKQGEQKGEMYFMARGIVKAPENHEGLPIVGLHTSIGPEPLCDTPSRSRKTFDEHWDWMLNELRKLGLDTKSVTVENLEAAAQALVSTGPYFRFRTWQPDPPTAEELKKNPNLPKNPRVLHMWGKAVKYVEGEEGPVAEDDTPAEEAEAAPWDSDDLVETGKAADNGDEQAQIALAAKAKEAGIDPDDLGTWAEVVEAIQSAESVPADVGEATYAAKGSTIDTEGSDELIEELTALAGERGLDPDDFGTWEELGTALDGSGGSENSGAEASGGDWKPEVGEIYLYQAAGMKKKGEFEVAAVYEKARKADLKSLDDNKVRKGISWDDFAG